MNKKIHALCSCLLLTPPIALADIIAVSYDGSVYNIDSATGASSLLNSESPQEYGCCNSLARASDGTLYTFTGGVLKTVNESTGAVSSVGTVALTNVRGLAIDEYDTMYIVQNGTDYYANGGNSGQIIYGRDKLYSYGLNDGVLTSLGEMAYSNVQGLTISPGGTLFGWDVEYGLLTVDKSAAIAVNVNFAKDGNYDIQTLAFDRNGQLYGAYNNNLYLIDTSNGSYSLVGSGDFYDIRGMEFSYVPLPGAAWLLATGFLAMVGIFRPGKNR